jgi:hypothetical protein
VENPVRPALPSQAKINKKRKKRKRKEREREREN